MAEVFFYQLQRSSLDATLRILLEKSLAAGWRVVVRGRTPEALDRLDEQLWLRPDVGFLPHGRAGGPHDADQPVLLTTDRVAPNSPDCLISIEGAEIAAAETAALARGMIVFDGRDEAELQTAREQWKSLTGAGVTAKYWSEETGRWQMKADSATT